MAIPRLVESVIAVLALAACAHALPAPESFGVVARTERGHLPCVTFPTAATPGERATIILFPSQQSLGATIGPPIAECGSGQEPGHAYRLEPDGAADHVYGSIAVRGKASAGVSFRQCSGSETLHLTAWRGGRRIWHGTYYLGYDVEPDCTPEQVE